MDPDLLIKDGHHPGSFRIAQLKDYRLKLGSRATLIPEPLCETWGTIMELPAHELARLYSAPSVCDYRSVLVKCVVENDLEVEADVYILDPDEPLAPPKNATYAKQLIAICKKIGLPQSYKQEIEALIKKIEE
ncbi:MAG: gamma-glutamylcyclotransferase [Kordiimonadaceae bacterium]|nr:gamma-glutamylcyclotransferase [Kordiimonadaceae bacterium]